MNLAQFRAAVLDRTQLSSGDTLAEDGTLDRQINAALYWVQRKNPHPWSWQWTRGSSYVTVSGTFEVPLDLIFTTATVRRVSEVRLYDSTSGLVTEPLSRVSYQDAYTYFPNLLTPAQPEMWAIRGQIITLRPTPLSGYGIRALGVATEVDLVDDADEPLMFAEAHDVVVEKAASLMFRRIHSLKEAGEANAAALDEVKDLVRADREYTGPGRVQVSPDRNFV